MLDVRISEIVEETITEVLGPSGCMTSLELGMSNGELVGLVDVARIELDIAFIELTIVCLELDIVRLKLDMAGPVVKVEFIMTRPELAAILRPITVDVAGTAITGFVFSATNAGGTAAPTAPAT